MSRKKPSPRKARSALLALRLEKTRYEMRALRRAQKAAEAALALRVSTPDWVDLKQQVLSANLEAEMQAMEACIDAGKPNIPILDMSLMPAFARAAADTPDGEDLTSQALPPQETPPQDLAPQDLSPQALTPQETAYANIKRPVLPKGQTYAHPGYDDHRHPADDWRNYE